MATCPGCGGALRAKCGAAKKQIWHWAHVAAECDPWHEPEGEWHLAWKSRAPEECTEVVIGPHRADIRTREGVVIELQASPIDAVEIAERETFYDRMIWLLDGRDWRKGQRFGFARGQVRLCECAFEIRGHIYRRRYDCKQCRSGILVEQGHGDRYVWDHRRKSFDDAHRPVYVDTGENIVLLQGSPRRFGGAQIMAYPDFCRAFGLAWDPAVDDVDVQTQQEDRLPDGLFVIKPRPGQPKLERRAQAVPDRPDCILAKIAIAGVPLERCEAASPDVESVESIAAALRANIEHGSVCVGHEPHALVEVSMSQRGMGWSVQHVCCKAVSDKIVSSLKYARRRLGVVKRRQTLATRRS